MRFLIERFLPHFNIALSLSLIVVTILNIYNPMMGFLQGTPAVVLIGAECVISICNAVSAYVLWRRARTKSKHLKEYGRLQDRS